jgi:diguanylate cyclase (GGDEF)-like protein
MKAVIVDIERVKSEGEYIREIVLTGLALTTIAILLATAVTWWTTHNYTTYLHHKAMRTAFLLPLIIAPTCVYIMGQMGLRYRRQLIHINKLAFTDEMTGLDNRRAFMREAKEMLAATDLDETGLCVMILDLDHFKAVNDQYGHEAGDLALSNAGKQIGLALPPEALIARFGGEEFIVMMQYQEIAEVYEHAEAVRSQVAARPCAYGHERITVTVSIGASMAYDGDTVPSMMNRADSALYEAKAEGRNRFMLAA